MFRKIRNLLLFSDFPRSELKRIRPQIMEENRKFCMVWTIIHILFWTYCLIMSFSNDIFIRNAD